jgi:hypothetical protein
MSHLARQCAAFIYCQMVIRMMLAALCLALNAVPVSGQSSDPNAAVVDASTGVATVVRETAWPVPRFSVSAEHLRGAAQATQRVGPRDSLRNGAIIGAVVGALAFGGFAAVLCHAYQEEGGASCVTDTLRFAAIGAGIGAGAGLAIDAARARHPGVTVQLAIGF